MKFRLPKKALTMDEAKTEKQKSIMMIQTCKEEIEYWTERDMQIKSPNDLLLFSFSGENSIEDIVNKSYEKIRYINYRIDNYTNKFLGVK